MVTRCKILEFQMWGRAYFVRSSFLVLTWEGGSNSGASNQIGPRNEIWFSSYPLLTYSSCWWLTIFGLTIGDDNPKWIDIECWNWVWPLIIWWETSERSNLYLGVTPKVKILLCINSFGKLIASVKPSISCVKSCDALVVSDEIFFDYLSIIWPPPPLEWLIQICHLHPKDQAPNYTNSFGISVYRYKRPSPHTERGRPPMDCMAQEPLLCNRLFRECRYKWHTLLRVLSYVWKPPIPYKELMH